MQLETNSERAERPPARSLTEGTVVRTHATQGQAVDRGDLAGLDPPARRLRQIVRLHAKRAAVQQRWIKSQAVDASDPPADSPGNPSQREKVS